MTQSEFPKYILIVVIKYQLVSCNEENKQKIISKWDQGCSFCRTYVRWYSQRPIDGFWIKMIITVNRVNNNWIQFILS